MPNWDRQTYEAYLARRTAKTCLDAPISAAEPEQVKTPVVDCSVSGETKSAQRITVRFIFHRQCLIKDRDNYSSSPKDLLDGLQHAGFIQEDSEREIELEVEQVKVKHKWEQKTVIEIIWP